MRVLLMSAYDAHSHRRWREGLVAAFPQYDWTVLTLPPRYFAWRVRGNSLGWAFAQRDLLERPYDLLVATSMTDLSALKGMVPALAAVPALVYFHENQFAYPDRRYRQRNEPGITSLYAALAADGVIFNSAYNRDSFLEGVDAFLAEMPDAVPPGVTDALAGRSEVIPVPLESCWFEPVEKPLVAKQPLTLVWNHRWEHDKAPERLFAALRELKSRGVEFRVHVIGQQFRSQPGVFEESRGLLQDSIGEWGMVETQADYRRVLQQSHVVLSTSLHEFQGLAVLDAVACGCLPLVPDRLSYPGLFPRESCYASHVDDPGTECNALVEKLTVFAEAYAAGELPGAPVVEAYAWESLAPAYAAAFERVMA